MNERYFSRLYLEVGIRSFAFLNHEKFHNNLSKSCKVCNLKELQFNRVGLSLNDTIPVTEEQQAWPHDGEDVWSSMLTLHTAGLAYLMLDNHNSDFQLFLQHFTTDQYQLLQQKLNCSQIFTDCFI